MSEQPTDGTGTGTGPGPGTPSPPDPTQPRRAIPKWRAAEQDLWLDCFMTYSEALMQDTLSKAYKDEHPWTDDATRTHLRADLEQAAILADGAVEETLYRKFIQDTAPHHRRARTRSHNHPPRLPR